MNYLVTGGLGFIGKSLINKLVLNPNNSIRVIDDLSVGKYSDHFQDTKVKEINFEDIKTGPKGIEFLQANISDYKVALKIY